MKVKKVAGVFLALFLALVLALACVVLFWLGPTVKAVAQRVGSKVLGTPLTIKTLAINPRRGTLQLSGFLIENPDDFGRTHAVSLASLDIALDMGSLFTPTVVVSRIQIESPHFTYEQNAATDNISEFIRNIESLSKADPNEPEPAKKPKEDDGKPGKTVVVQALEINDIQVHLANTDDPQLDIALGLEQLAVSMTNGNIRLKKLHCTNPGRLATPNLFTLDGIAIQLDPASILSGPLSIRDVRVTQPYVYLERNLETHTVAELWEIAHRFAGQGATNTAPQAAVSPPAKPAESAPPPFELHHLLVDDIQLRLLDTTQTNAPAEPVLLAGIGSVSVKLTEGRLGISGISVPSPAGFATSNLFHLAGIDITADPASLFSKQVVINEILVNAPEINFEQTATHGNATELQAILLGFAPPPGPAKPVAPSSSPAPKAKPVPLADQPVVLHALVVSNLAINLTLPPTTNSSVLGLNMSGMGRFNPMDKVSLGKLNPMEYMGKGTNSAIFGEAPPKEGPVTLLSFRHLLARPLDGVVHIDDLQVGNVRGFANKNLVELQQFRIELDPDSITSGTLLIKEILIDTPRVSYERQITTDNIKALQLEIGNALSRRAEYDGTEEPTVVEPAPSAGKKAEPAQKVIIAHLLVHNGMVRAKLSALPTAPIPLPKIEMHDFGKAEGGATFGDALAKLGTIFYDAIIRSVSDATGFAGEALKGAGTFTLDAFGSMTGSLGDAVGKGVKSSENAIGETVEKLKEKLRRDNKEPRPGRVF